MNMNMERPKSVRKPHPASSAPEKKEHRLRAVVYSLLARLLKGSPDADLLRRLRAIPGQDINSHMGTAWLDLRTASYETDVDCVQEEYRLLFEGLSAGEVIPYASWHLTGQLMDRPLATLRRDLTRMGCRRRNGVNEPEDHAAALCEVMALLCMDPAPEPETQARFFHRHLKPWMASFFQDLKSAPSARFYRAVGRFGARFLELEVALFDGEKRHSKKRAPKKEEIL
jgi:TorA maturation chaperone TorD